METKTVGVIGSMELTADFVKAAATVRAAMADFEQMIAGKCNLRQESICTRSMMGQYCSECPASADKVLLEQEEEAVAFKTCHKRQRLMMGHKIADDCCREGIPVTAQRRNCEYCPALSDFLDLLGELDKIRLNISSRRELSC